MSKVVFLDTNVYLHYQLFDQINWPKVLKASAVTIVIPPVTIRELNKHKELHPRPRVKKRAGAVLKKLFALFKSGAQAHLRDGVEIRLEDRDPVIDFAAFQLNPEIQDDNLIASIVVFQNENPEAEVILVTSDAGLTLMAKAGRQGIPTIKLPDNLKLSEEPDPYQKRIRELEQELRELKLKAPQLSLAFENGGQHITFVLPHPVDLTQEELNGKLEKIKQSYPKMKQQPEQARELPEHLASIAEVVAGLNASAGNIVLPEDIDKYNTKLEEFYQAYAEYLRRDVRYQNLKRRTVKLTIFVANDGTAPAEDIDVFMHFPDGFNLMSERDFPEPPEPPKPPAKPRTRMQKLLESISGSLAEEVPSLREGEAAYWLTPVKSVPEQTAEECIRTLVGEERIYAFGERTPGRRYLKPGDWMCFYATGGKGVIAHAQVASFPEKEPHPKVARPERYPWVFQVTDAQLYLDEPTVIDADLRAQLDAFQDKDLTKHWAWFVQATRKITQHDFRILTRQQA